MSQLQVGRLRAASREAIAEAAAVLRRGGLVAFPTETVYGLGANALDPRAVERIFAAKQRPADNPLIIHVADTSALDSLVATITPLARSLVTRFWPGPLTLILDAAPSVPRVTTGGLGTVAVRMPDHPVALQLIRAAGVPVAAPSANRSGRPSPTTAAHVAHDLGGVVDLLLDAGPTGVGLESTVVDARGAHALVYREGAVSREDLGPRSATGQRLSPSPGTRYRHYAPGCPVEIIAVDDLQQRARAMIEAGLNVGVVVPRSIDVPGALIIRRFEDSTELAHGLYDALRTAEEAGVDVLLCSSVPETGIGRAVMDRLRRAAGTPQPRSDHTGRPR